MSVETHGVHESNKLCNVRGRSLVTTVSAQLEMDEGARRRTRPPANRHRPQYLGDVMLRVVVQCVCEDGDEPYIEYTAAVSYTDLYDVGTDGQLTVNLTKRDALHSRVMHEAVAESFL